MPLWLSDAAYEAVKRNAAADNQSMNTWPERVLEILEVEDMRRRCAAHRQRTAEHPGAVASAETWADRNFQELPRR